MASPRLPHKGIAQIHLAKYFLRNGDSEKADEWIAQVDVSGESKDVINYHLQNYTKKKAILVASKKA